MAHDHILHKASCWMSGLQLVIALFTSSACSLVCSTWLAQAYGFLGFLTGFWLVLSGCTAISTACTDVLAMSHTHFV